MCSGVIESHRQSHLLSLGEQPHPTSPIREECNFTEGLSDRRGNEGEVEKKEKRKKIKIYLFLESCDSSTCSAVKTKPFTRE